MFLPGERRLKAGHSQDWLPHYIVNSAKQLFRWMTRALAVVHYYFPASIPTVIVFVREQGGNS